MVESGNLHLKLGSILMTYMSSKTHFSEALELFHLMENVLHSGSNKYFQKSFLIWSKMLELHSGCTYTNNVSKEVCIIYLVAISFKNSKTILENIQIFLIFSNTNLRPLLNLRVCPCVNSIKLKILYSYGKQWILLMNLPV